MKLGQRTERAQRGACSFHEVVRKPPPEKVTSEEGPEGGEGSPTWLSGEDSCPELGPVWLP